MIETKKLLVADWNQSPKKFKKSSEASVYYLEKLKQAIGTFETKFQMQNIVLAHCLAQISFIQSWVNKMGNSLKESLSHILARMK